MTLDDKPASNQNHRVGNLPRRFGERAMSVFGLARIDGQVTECETDGPETQRNQHERDHHFRLGGDVVPRQSTF